MQAARGASDRSRKRHRCAESGAMEGTEPPQPAVPSAGAVSDYPVTFSVEYPDRKLNRVSTGFRIFAAIPILILAVMVTGGYEEFWHPGVAAQIGGIAGGILFLPVLLMILFREKYPRWWYDWNLQVSRFSARIGVYLSLMDDRYPSTDEQQSVSLDFPHPDPKTDVDRAMPLVKWLLAIPHYIVLFLLYIAAFFVVIFAWFAILFTGRYPRGAFEFVEGVYRWHYRVVGYVLLLVTDKYPPFRLAP
jgi:uncharacterized protein DUF4389